MKKFSILLVLLSAFSLVYAQEDDLTQKKKSFYLQQYDRFVADKDFLQAFGSIEKLQKQFADGDFTSQLESLEDSIFSVAKYCQENYNADKAVEYLKFYTMHFTQKKGEVYNALSSIYSQAGDKQKADFYAKKAKEFE